MIAAGVKLRPRPVVGSAPFVRLLTNFVVRVFSFGWCVAPLKLAISRVFTSYICDRNRTHVRPKS